MECVDVDLFGVGVLCFDVCGGESWVVFVC